MRAISAIPSVLLLLSALAPASEACVVYSRGSETTEYSVTAHAGDDAVTVGAYVTQERHEGSESVCIVAGLLFTLASTQVTPFVVLP